MVENLENEAKHKEESNGLIHYFLRVAFFFFCILKTNLISRRASRFSQKKKKKGKNSFIVLNKFDKHYMLYPLPILVQICLLKETLKIKALP